MAEMPSMKGSLPCYALLLCNVLQAGLLCEWGELVLGWQRQLA